MSVHSGLHCPHLNAINRDLNKVLSGTWGNTIKSKAYKIPQHLDIICYMLNLPWSYKLWCCWYSVISSGDDEGNISELTVCWKLELLGSQEITAEVEVMLAAWR